MPRYIIDLILLERPPPATGAPSVPAQVLQSTRVTWEENELLPNVRALFQLGRMPRSDWPLFEAIRVGDEAGTELLRWNDIDEYKATKKEAAERAKWENELRKAFDAEDS